MDRKQNIFKKISIVILILSLSFLSVKYFKDANTYTKQIQKSELEIKILESQLDEILTKYDSLQVKSKKNSDLLLQNEDVRSLNDYFISKNQDSIVVEKKRQSSTSAIKKSRKKTNGLAATNINVKAVKIFSALRKEEDSKIKQLRVCYTLSSTQYIDSGSKKIYIQVVNPKNQIISNNNNPAENEFGTVLSYSAISNVFFENRDADDCLYVNLEEGKTIKGNFIINIYADFTKIGSSIFEYK